MLRTCVIWHEVDQDAHAECVCVLNQRDDFVEGAKARIDVAIVSDVVAAIVVRALVER